MANTGMENGSHAAVYRGFEHLFPQPDIEAEEVAGDRVSIISNQVAVVPEPAESDPCQ